MNTSTILVCLAALLPVACTSPLGNRSNSFGSRPLQVGRNIAFLEPEQGRLLAFDTQTKMSQVLSGSSDANFGAILDAQSSAAPPLSAGPSLAVLSGATLEGPATTLSVVLPDLQVKRATLDREYSRMLVDDSLAVVLPALPDNVRSAGGGGTSGVGPTATGDPKPIEQFAVVDLTAAIDKFEVAFSNANRLVEMRVGRGMPGSTWLALASAMDLALVRIPSSRTMGAANYAVDLSGRQTGATKPPKLIFDAKSSRLFVWAPGSAEVLGLSLSPADVPLATAVPDALPLLRVQFDSIPTDVELVRTGMVEVLVGVTPDDNGATKVTLIDPATKSARAFEAPLPADSVEVLRAATSVYDTTPDTVLFFSTDLEHGTTGAIGLASAAALFGAPAATTAGAESAEQPSPITVVSLQVPYRSLTVIGSSSVLLQNTDGMAGIYDPSEAKITQLKNWNRLVGFGSFASSRIISKRPTGSGSYQLQAFSRDGTTLAHFEVPADVKSYFDLSGLLPAPDASPLSASVFVHPSALGLLTYYNHGSTRGPASYTAVGFLTEEQAR